MATFGPCISLKGPPVLAGHKPIGEHFSDNKSDAILADFLFVSEIIFTVERLSITPASYKGKFWKSNTRVLKTVLMIYITFNEHVSDQIDPTCLPTIQFNPLTLHSFRN